MNAARFREAGDAALLLELAPAIDPAINARAIAIADAIRNAALPGVRDVVSTFRSVAIYFDPLITDVDAVRERLQAVSGQPLPRVTGRSHVVPVKYGGEAGPDLAAVSQWAGLSADEVIARHAERDYRVFMLGFRPGFAYLGSVDPSIAAPRHATPRLRVPAGSVGIAGMQTGIYPSESPGGWQIIGRTALPIFDRGSGQALFAPGDAVRFRAVDDVAAPPLVGAGFSQPDGVRLQVVPMASSRRVTVLAPGLFTTVQDGGEYGRQGSGVPVGGAMDLVSLRAANLAVGNSPDAPALEATIVGPELRFEGPVRVAVAGADFGARLDGHAVPLSSGVQVDSGGVLRFDGRRAGARVYIACDGGIAAPSRSQTIRAGDVLALGPARGPGTTSVPRPLPDGGARVRVLRGPQEDGVGGRAWDALLSTRFTIAPQSNRMGYRLTSSPPLPAASEPMISDATFTGGIQLPSSGSPILLMADRQTTGGYPQIATVITADLPLVAQLAPGDWIAFVACSRADARRALAALDVNQHG